MKQAQAQARKPIEVDRDQWCRLDRYPPYCPDVVMIHATNFTMLQAGIQIGHMIVRPPGPDGTTLAKTVGCVVQFIDGGVGVNLRRTDNGLMLADDLSRFAPRELARIGSVDDLRIAIGPAMFAWTKDVIRVDVHTDQRAPNWRKWCRERGQ
jgi:hypothetical protein